MPKYRELFLKKHNLPLNKSLNIKEISDYSKIPLKTLEIIYNRALETPKSNLPFISPNKRMSYNQLAFGRLYSYVMKSPEVYYGLDVDIRNY